MFMCHMTHSVSRAVSHCVILGSFELVRGYRERGMAAYADLQNAEFAAEARGYTATRHQREVGTGYFDAVSVAIKGADAATTALHDSTEAAQFQPAASLHAAAE